MSYLIVGIGGGSGGIRKTPFPAFSVTDFWLHSIMYQSIPCNCNHPPPGEPQGFDQSLIPHRREFDANLSPPRRAFDSVRGRKKLVGGCTQKIRNL
jgi:hypothetical protein